MVVLGLGLRYIRGTWGWVVRGDDNGDVVVGELGQVYGGVRVEVGYIRCFGPLGRWR